MKAAEVTYFYKEIANPFLERRDRFQRVIINILSVAEGDDVIDTITPQGYDVKCLLLLYGIGSITWMFYWRLRTHKCHPSCRLHS